MVLKKKTTKRSFIKKLLALDDDSKEEAQEGKYFVLQDGKLFKSPKDLMDALGAMPEEQFDYHTKQGRNDFANWLWFVFDEKELADTIFKAKTQKDTLKILKKHYG